MTTRYPEYQKSFHPQLEIHSGDGTHTKSREVHWNGHGGEDLEKRDTDRESLETKSISVLGLERYEVLALLVSSCLSLMAGSVVSVEVVARFIDQPNVHT